MFLKTGELKKMMKAALKSGGLYMGNINGRYLVYASAWGLSTDITYASNKFKAALMELIGDIPEPSECYRYYCLDKEMHQDMVTDYPSAYDLWKEAKDYATYAPFYLSSWPHTYTMLQIHSDLSYKLADKNITTDVISDKELDLSVENVPGKPNYSYGVLYWKNDTTIYWVYTTKPSEKTKETLLPRLEGLSFFENDWLAKEEEKNQEEELSY